MKNPLIKIEEYFIQRKILQAINAKFREVGIYPTHRTKLPSYTFVKPRDPSFLYSSVDNWTYDFVPREIRERIREINKGKGKYGVEIRIVGKRSAVRERRDKKGHEWEFLEETPPEGYVHFGVTSNPYFEEELEEFDREVLSLEKQEKILSHQLKESVRDREAAKWKKRRKEGRGLARERWGRDKSCPQCYGDGEDPVDYHSFKICEGCGGKKYIESLGQMERFFVPTLSDLDRMTEIMWRSYEQKRWQQMGELGLEKPSNKANIYIKVVERKK